MARQAIHYALLDYFKEEIEDLDLESEASGTPSITYDIIKAPTGDWVQDLSGSDPATYPLIAVSHEEDAERELPEFTTNLYTAMGYPILVFIVDVDRGDGDGGSVHGRLDHVKNHHIYLAWRELIITRFVGKSISFDDDTPSVCDVSYQPKPIMSKQEWKDRGGLWVSGLKFEAVYHLPKIAPNLTLPAWDS